VTDDDREVYRCQHWVWHRMAALGQLPYGESQILVDEWIGAPPREAVAAIERGERDLTPWCPVLNAASAAAHFPI
jgi:hypothetical protein